MSKRFVDTNLGREPWFRRLPPVYKCAVRFLFDECDMAGIWIIDMETMSYFVGEEIKLDALFKSVNVDKVNRIEMLNKDKIFIPGFVPFQYGELSDKCKPHLRVMQILAKHGLLQRVSKGYAKGIHTLEDKDRDKDRDKDKVKEEGNVVDISKSNLYRQPKIPTFEQVNEAFVRSGGTSEQAEAFFNKHQSTGWFLNGSPITNFSTLIPSYLRAWNENRKQSPSPNKFGMTL